MGYKKDIPYLFEGIFVYYLGEDNDNDCWWKGHKESLSSINIGIFKHVGNEKLKENRYFEILKKYDVPFAYSCEDFKIFDYFSSGIFYNDDEFSRPIKKTRLAKKLITNIKAETEDYIWV